MAGRVIGLGARIVHVRPAPVPGEHGSTRSPGDERHDQVWAHLAEAGIVPSIGSVGDSYDNALAETVIGLFKAEVIHRLGPWRNREAVEIATLEWVDWFNTRRLLEPIGHIPPADAEDRYYAQLATSHTAA